MSSKNKVEVKIHGKEYTVVGTESHEYIQKVALYIDRKMNEITQINDKLNTSMVAVLTAINVADDYFKSTRDADNMRSQLQRYIKDLSKTTEELNEYKKENETLKDKIQKLQLDIVKKETELNDFINNFDRSAKDNTVILDNARKARAK